MLTLLIRHRSPRRRTPRPSSSGTSVRVPMPQLRCVRRDHYNKCICIPFPVQWRTSENDTFNPRHNTNPHSVADVELYVTSLYVTPSLMETHPDGRVIGVSRAPSYASTAPKVPAPSIASSRSPSTLSPTPTLT